MSKIDFNNRITILAHSEFARLKYGESLIDVFRTQAVKKKYTLQIVYDINDIHDGNSPVVVIGVDSVWIRSVLSVLERMNDRIILISGVAHKGFEYISHISTDQHIATQKFIDLLKSKGRTRTAFFGVQKNDTSDQIKAASFSEHFPATDVYRIDNSVDECCEKFLRRIDSYDSVICANDILAVYLLAHCRSLKIEIPQKLHLIGYGNLWISSHVATSITTVASNEEALVEIAFQTCKNLCRIKGIAPININLSGYIIERESTGVSTQTESVRIPFDCVSMRCSLSQIATIEKVFSSYSLDKLNMMRLVADGVSIDKISEQVFLLQDSISYHLKKLYKQLGIHSKKELINILNFYGITF